MSAIDYHKLIAELCSTGGKLIPNSKHFNARVFTMLQDHEAICLYTYNITCYFANRYKITGARNLLVLLTGHVSHQHDKMQELDISTKVD